MNKHIGGIRFLHYGNLRINFGLYVDLASAKPHPSERKRIERVFFYNLRTAFNSYCLDFHSRYTVFFIAGGSISHLPSDIED